MRCSSAKDIGKAAQKKKQLVKNPLNVQQTFHAKKTVPIVLVKCMGNKKSSFRYFPNILKTTSMEDGRGGLWFHRY
jgi:hypothetical protein